MAAGDANKVKRAAAKRALSKKMHRNGPPRHKRSAFMRKCLSKTHKILFGDDGALINQHLAKRNPYIPVLNGA